MTDLEIRPFREPDQDAVVGLWQECGLVVPWNDPVRDIHRKLHVRRDMFLVGLLGPRLVATVMAGYEGHRGWVHYLAVAADCQQRGYGRRLMDEAEALLRAVGCPKINLQVRSWNNDVIGFYKNIGYTVDDVVSMGKRLEENQVRGEGCGEEAGVNESARRHRGKAMNPIDLADKLSQFDHYWSPRIIGAVNDSYVKLAKLNGEFVWHSHEQEDELFLVVKGRLTMRFRDGEIHLEEGQMVIVEKGVEHQPFAESETHVLIVEPKATVNTGDVVEERTVVDLEWI